MDLDELAAAINLEFSKHLKIDSNEDAIAMMCDHVFKNAHTATPCHHIPSTVGHIPDVVNQPVDYCKTFTESKQRRKRRPYTGRSGNIGSMADDSYDVLCPKCYHCGSRNTFDDVDATGDWVCLDCGTCTQNNICTDAFRCLPFDEYIAKSSCMGVTRNKVVYKREKYLNELLDRLTGVQNVEVPEYIYGDVSSKLTQGQRVTGKGVKNALMKSKLNRWYDHAYLIANTLSKNRSVIRVSHHERERIIRMFLKVENTFKTTSSGRKNCLNYPYVMSRLFRLIGRTDVSHELDMLKCRDRLHVHDKLWKDICEKMGWQFTPVL